MDDKIYLHAVDACDNKIYYEERLKKILSSGYLYSANMQGNLESGRGFNGRDYISLCDYEKRNLVNGKNTYNSYHAYIENSLSFAFPKELIDVSEILLIKPITRDRAGFSLMKKLGNDLNNRYSDFPDEVQVKDRISLDLSCGLVYPTKIFMTLYDGKNRIQKIELLKKEVKKLKRLMNDVNMDLPIYDLDSLEVLTHDRIRSIILTK